MRFDPGDIRGAMDRRLSALDASAGRRERIRQRIDQEEKVVRKKITVGMAFAITALLMLTGAALAVGLNLFERFGENDARLAQIAPQTTLVGEAPGTAVASINSAYYDGQSLLVAYSIEKSDIVERFTPTEEELARMTKVEDFAAPLSPGEEAPVLKEFAAAQQSGTPYGIVRYAVYPGDQTEMDDGTELSPARETEEFTPDGGRYVIREYENPLPEEAQNRESLGIRIPLYQSASRLYFDGKDLYELPSERKQAGAMTATAPRVAAEVRHFTGEGLYNGAKIRVEADASAVHASVTIIAEGDVFPPLPEDSWYEIEVRDAQGNLLRTNECGASDPRTLRAVLDGTGALPENLTASILIESEGEDAVSTPAASVLLTVSQ